jgi:hypothetical protein
MTSRKHPDFSGSEYVKVFHGTVCYQKLCRTFAVLCTSALICINNVCVIQSNNQGLGDFVYLHYKTQVRFLFVSLSTLSSETFSLLVSLSGAGQSLWGWPVSLGLVGLSGAGQSLWGWPVSLAPGN